MMHASRSEPQNGWPDSQRAAQCANWLSFDSEEGVGSVSSGGSKEKRSKEGKNDADRKGSKETVYGSSEERKGSKEKREKALMQRLTHAHSMEDIEEGLNNDEKLDQLANIYSREVFHTAETLPAVVLMNNGRFEDLTLRDVQDLFRTLDADHSGFLEFDEVAALLQEVLVPPCTDEQVDGIYALTSKRDDRKISAEELFKALAKGPVKDALKKMQNENRMIKELEQLLGFNIQVTRKALVSSLRSKAGRDDAFRTLPFSIAYICIFIALVTGHLNIWGRQQVERGLEAWIQGYGGKLNGPYIGAVANIDGMHGWLLDSGVRAVFGSCRNSSFSSDGLPLCEVGPKRVLVGDAVLKQKRHDHSEKSVHLLHSEEAQRYLHEVPGDYLGAVRTVVQHLQNITWADANTVDLRLSFSTYGVLSGLFALTDVNVRFDDMGFVLPTTSTQAVVVTPYPLNTFSRVAAFAIDVVYLLFLLGPMFSEVKDLCRGIRLSGFYDGVVSYVDVWNCVDWFNIIMGMVLCNIWILCCVAMQAESISSLLQEQSGRMVLVPEFMDLKVGDVDRLQDDLSRIRGLYLGMHIVMGLISLGIMLKFFKAFQANPRLKLVTDTMAKASHDILHFSIVFWAIFFGSAVSGHILFGPDLVQFRSLAASIDTCFIMLMGEFAWYEAESSSDLGLPSGLAYWALVIWFWLYMVLVLMVMINMLLAIILEHYGDLVNAIKNDVDVPALWEQAWRYFALARKTKDFIPDTDLLCLLEDRDTPCHEGERVTSDSLLAAFPDMQQYQADWLMAWLKNEAKKKLDQLDDEVVGRLKVLEHFADTITLDLHSVKLNTAICTSCLGHTSLKEKQKHGAAPSAKSRHDGIADRLGVQIDQLSLQVGATVREMSAKLGDATRTIERRVAGVKMSSVSTSQTASILSHEGGIPAIQRDPARRMPRCWESTWVS